MHMQATEDATTVVNISRGFIEDVDGNGHYQDEGRSEMYVARHARGVSRSISGCVYCVEALKHRQLMR